MPPPIATHNPSASRVGQSDIPPTEPLQFIASRSVINLSVGGKVNHWGFIGVRYPHEWYGHVSEFPAAYLLLSHD